MLMQHGEKRTASRLRSSATWIQVEGVQVLCPTVQDTERSSLSISLGLRRLRILRCNLSAAHVPGADARAATHYK